MEEFEERRESYRQPNLYEKAHDIAHSVATDEDHCAELTRRIADFAIIECMRQSERDHRGGMPL